MPGTRTSSATTLETSKRHTQLTPRGGVFSPTALHRRWVANLTWEGRPAHNPHPQPWMVDGEEAGTVTDYGAMQFLRIYKAVRLSMPALRCMPALLMVYLH